MHKEQEHKDITNNDMHIIEAIGLGEESTMSAVARTLGITAGSLTTSMNSLVNKKYVTRQRSETDRRVVYIQLTGKGKKAYEHHKNFHMQMTNGLRQSRKISGAISVSCFIRRELIWQQKKEHLRQQRKQQYRHR